MNVVRIAISLFILVLIAVSAAGCIWTGVHQTASQSAGSHVVLALNNSKVFGMGVYCMSNVSGCCANQPNQKARCAGTRGSTSVESRADRS